MRTADAHAGAREFGLMPTYHCEACGAHVWDTDVQDALATLTGSAKAADVDGCVTGAECPACGSAQSP